MRRASFIPLCLAAAACVTSEFIILTTGMIPSETERMNGEAYFTPAAAMACFAAVAIRLR